ncbi:MAG: glycosyltransferase family 39 protein [Chloroflexota bacterium]|nr:glycosyltransferase family 39 protein [Chloroflexota bacterium]MDQ5865564.1 glycosyltransferase family 39 protein [Chloroflexota bacterium]
MSVLTHSRSLPVQRVETVLVARYAGWLLSGIVVLALGIRAWGLDFGLPSLYHPDEPTHVVIALNMLKTGDLNPHFFDYPSLFFYIHALAYIPYFLFGKVMGIFDTPLDIPYPVTHLLGVGSTTMPSTFMLGRWLTVLFGVAVVVLVYMVGKQLFDKPGVGLLAAFITAVSPASVNSSRFITPNIMLTFFGVLGLYGAVMVLKRGDTRDYVLAGVGAGLAASIKYNGVLLVVVIAAAHFLRAGLEGFKDRRVYMAPLLAGAIFFLTTPFAILDSEKFLHDVRADAQHYATAHFGMEGNALGWYVDYLWSVEGLIVLPAIAAMIRGAIVRSRPLLMLSVFPVIYFIFISTFVVRNDRTVLPLLPFLALLGSSLLFYLLGLVWPPNSTARKLAAGAVGLVMAVSVVYPLWQTVERTQQGLSGVASRDAARDWINSSIAAGSHVAVEAYGPVIDDTRFKVDWVGRVTQYSAAQYAEQGVDYVVASGGIFNRFYREPARYPGDIQQYDTLFGQLEPVRTFPEQMYEIRVYKVPER